MPPHTRTDESTTALDVYFHDLERHPLLDWKGERELARLASAGDAAAQERLVTCNLRFVVGIAKRYQGFGLPLEDLICEGNRGLIRAAQTFDPDRGVRLVTYAARPIIQRINRALDLAPTVRLKGTTPASLWRIRRDIAKLSQAVGEMLSNADLAHALGVDQAVITEALNVPKAFSLDDTYDDTAPALAERLAPDDQLFPDEDAYATERREVVLAVVNSLPEREATLIRLRFGLGSEPPLTQDEVAVRLTPPGQKRISRQRVQQLEAQALKRLQEHGRARHLHPFRQVDDNVEMGDGPTPRLRLPVSRKPAHLPQSTSAPGTAAPDTAQEPRAPLARRLAANVPALQAGAPTTLRTFVVDRIRATSIEWVAAHTDVPVAALQDLVMGIVAPSEAHQKLSRWYEQSVPPDQRVAEIERARPALESRTRPKRGAGSPPRPAGWAFVRGSRADEGFFPRIHSEPTGQSGAGDSLVEIRELAQERTARVGGRRVAAEMGVSQEDLRLFLAGGIPRDPIDYRIVRWSQAVRPDDNVAGDYREISVETLREFLIDLVSHSSLGAVARAAGVGKNGLHKFITRATEHPHGRTHRLLGLHYLRIRQASTTPTAAASAGTSLGAPVAAEPTPAAPGPLAGVVDTAPSPPLRERHSPSSRGDTAEQTAGTPPDTSKHEATDKPAATAAKPRPLSTRMIPERREPPARPTDSGHPPPEHLRCYYLGLALRTSVNALAGPLGVSDRELIRFLQGGDGDATLLGRLATDYRARALIRNGALEALLADMDEVAAASTREVIVAAVEGGYRESGILATALLACPADQPGAAGPPR